MNCRAFREIIDSYLSDELLVETNHDFLRHLEDCADCRREVAERREFVTRLRFAVRTAPELQMSNAFRLKLQENLYAAAFPTTFWEKIKNNYFFNIKFSALAAALLLMFIFGGLILNSKLHSNGTGETAQTQPTAVPDGNPNAGLPDSLPAIPNIEKAVHNAVGDHLNCAVKFNLEEKPISLDQAAEKFGKFNKNIDRAVIEPLEKIHSPKSPEKIKLLEAHSCAYQNIPYAHIVLRYHEQVVSVLVSETENDKNSVSAGDETIKTLTDGTIRAAVFNAALHQVFVVSQLPEADNQAIARQIEPSLKNHIEQLSANNNRFSKNNFYAAVNFFNIQPITAY